MIHPITRRRAIGGMVGTLIALGRGRAWSAQFERRLYVAVPGIRDYLEYGGHGVLVFDIDNGHTFVKRIPSAGLSASGKPLNVKGICASAKTGRLYVGTTQHLMCIDLVSEALLWERTYDAGCDRMAISPDGQTMYMPSFEGDLWYVLDADTGRERARVTPNSGAHNTIAGLDGREAYLAGLRSPLLTVLDAKTLHTRTVGPFGASIRPFTVNGRQTLVFVNVNELLGFEVGDLREGKRLHRVEVAGFSKGPIKRHGCPSHGIGLTPDESELWVCDAHNQSLHVFDATAMPPKQAGTIKLKDEPGWVTFSLDGKYAYPSTGDVIDVSSRAIVTELRDEKGAAVQSEKVVEVHLQDGRPVKAGDQFGLGRVVESLPETR
jgi:DNA-binding beta-propeller fold protein YncE